MLSRDRILKMENGEDLAYKNVQVTLLKVTQRNMTWFEQSL